MPTDDDTTPRGVDWGSHECRAGIRRMEGKIDRVLVDIGTHNVSVAVLATEIDAIKKWQADQDASRSQVSLGVKSAIASAVASPIVMLGISFLHR